MAVTTDFQSNFCAATRDAAKSILEAADKAKALLDEWEARGANDTEREAWLDLMFAATDYPCTRAEIVSAATDALDLLAFLDNAAVASKDRRESLIKVRQS